ncbi:hypothetical protein [Phytohabitans suffuscus]|uniref:Uncharacterized protein n=1 Tax=Phytohabitans suffuscus TaxID=624315 RepID=A0A6F8YKC5_9ACTN|nr:hypothetical protein [Phytohabitans suffuscus]BCB86527.1 hypothetical protein Psuf_038400 [Phytohabitans suffuscus]
MPPPIRRRAPAPVAHAAALPSVSRDPGYVIRPDRDDAQLLDALAAHRESAAAARRASRLAAEERLDVLATRPGDRTEAKELAEWRHASGERRRKVGVVIGDRARVVLAARMLSARYVPGRVVRSVPAKAPARAPSPARAL